VSGGRLRDSVAVKRLLDYVRLTFSFWELDLPREWVEGSEPASALLGRRASAADVAGFDPQLDALITLLSVQGCLTYPDDKPSYQLREVAALYRALCSTWYGIYYRHPLWTRLREGNLSRNALIAWLIHNYHLSRSAGMSASRCATRCEREDIKSAFRDSAIEEYPHCEQFYFVQHSHLSIPDRDVKECLRLPSTLAFDHQMLHIAEEDWLGHVLVGLFQESTARFLDSCRDFYRVIEEKYVLPCFFTNWEKHISLDLEYGHAGAFAQVLESDELVDHDHLVFSLRNAYFTFAFLLGSLDDILAEERPDGTVHLRLPTSPMNALSFTLFIKNRQDRNKFLAVNPSVRDREFFSEDFTDSLFRVLSYCTGHDEALVFGRLAEIAAKTPQRMGKFRQPDSIWAQATANHCREMATIPVAFAYLTLHLENYPDCETFLPVGSDNLDSLRTWAAQVELSPDEAARVWDAIDDLDRFMTRWHTDTAAVVPDNLFRM
jgi:TENA/THI-4/PQQC family